MFKPFLKLHSELCKLSAFDREAICVNDPGQNRVCCHQDQILPVPVGSSNSTSKCSDFAGFSCVPETECRGNAKLLKDGNKPDVLRAEGGVLEINPEGSKCPKDLEVCCTTKNVQTPPKQPVVKGNAKPVVLKPSNFKPKCGRRNHRGIDVRIHNPDGDRDNSTQFGEWPHMCGLYIMKPLSGDLSFLAGASLIAPGVLLTVTHRIM